MTSIASRIPQIARSEMSRNALACWEKFKLPAPNPEINALLKQLESAGGKR